jgi:putative peptide maturation dehydrogenase
MRLRRRRPCVIDLGDRLAPDIGALLRGEMRLLRSPAPVLLCPVSGERLPVSPEALALMATLDGDTWVELEALAARGPLGADALRQLVADGLLVGDGDDAWSVRLREGEARLEEVGWHPLAAVYHAHTAWSGIMGDEAQRDHSDEAHRARLDAMVAANGYPPPHSPERPDARSRHPLPPAPLDSPLAALMRRRRTTRHYLADATLPAADLAHVLRGTFGAVGHAELAPGLVAMKRLSPSGGALHPIEAYPLLIRVEGFAPGLYHYVSDHHRLDLLQPMDEDAARAFAGASTIGQDYFAEAQAMVFMAARLRRNHWKYRRHAKAYKAVLVDAGHLSQTAYLLATERGLGAYYTGAINDRDIARTLGLDPLGDAVFGAWGLGVPDPSRDALHFVHADHEPAPAG